MATGLAAGGGDVGRAGEAVAADGEVAQRRHDRRAVAGPYLGVGFCEHDIADPVQSVLDRPVPADDLGEVLGADLVEVQVGDRVDGLAVPAAGGGTGGASTADDATASWACGNRIPPVTRFSTAANWR